jgi:integrase/recombinase XerD
MLQKDMDMQTIADTEQRTIQIVATEFKVVSPIAEWAETFLKAKRAEGLAKGSIRFYAESFKSFLSFCDLRCVRQVEEVDADTLRAFLLWLREQGHNPGGIHGHYHSVRAFLRWYAVEVEPEGFRNPCDRVKAPKLVDIPLPAVELETVERLCRAASGAMATRDRAILLTLADSGVRAAELLALDLEDVDSFTGEMRVRCGKGSKSRTVFVGRRTRLALRAYLKQRDILSEALFLSSEGGARLRYPGLRQVVRRLSQRAGLPKPPPIHSFRRCFAINFLRNGGDLLSLSRLLGHSGLSLLARYANQNVDDLQRAHASHSPIDRGT